jgi:hypothetical protein
MLLLFLYIQQFHLTAENHIKKRMKTKKEFIHTVVRQASRIIRGGIVYEFLIYTGSKIHRSKKTHTQQSQSNCKIHSSPSHQQSSTQQFGPLRHCKLQ